MVWQYIAAIKKKITLFSQFGFPAACISESSPSAVAVKAHLMQNLKSTLSFMFIFQARVKEILRAAPSCLFRCAHTSPTALAATDGCALQSKAAGAAQAAGRFSAMG